MRSFRSKLVSVAAWAAPVLAAALPHAHTVSLPPLGAGKLLNLDSSPQYAQAVFSVPCAGCRGQAPTGQDDESLLLDFRSHAQDQACGSSNLTLNGVALPQEWSGDFASGSALSVQHERFDRRDLDLVWNSTCLYGSDGTNEPAQVLTVSITAVDGQALSTPAGFTVSFRQNTSPPALLRLEPLPNLTVTGSASADWHSPPLSLRLVYKYPDFEAFEPSSPPSLEEEILELRALQSELRDLQSAIHAKKISINTHLKNEAQGLTKDLKQCTNLKCLVQTVAHKAHGAWRVAHWRFYPYRLSGMSRPEYVNAYAQAQAHTPSSQVSGGHIKIDAEPDTELLQPSPAPEDLPPRPPKPSPYVIALEVTLSLLCCGCLVAVIRHKCASLRTRTDRAAAREERLAVQAYRRAARKHAWRSWWRGNWQRRNRDVSRIADYEEKRALITSQESILEDAMQEEIRQLRAAHDVVNDLVRDAEEGRVIAHGPCTCHRSRAPSRSRSRMRHSQPLPRHMTRPPYSPISIASTYPPTSLPDVETDSDTDADVPSRPLSRTDSLPSYRSSPPSEPPSYCSDTDSQDGRCGAVANGLRYSGPASVMSEEGWTPESSVVDVSPRPSAETLRYAVSVFTLDEEEEEEEEEDSEEDK